MDPGWKGTVDLYGHRETRRCVDARSGPPDRGSARRGTPSSTHAAGGRDANRRCGFGAGTRSSSRPRSANAWFSARRDFAATTRAPRPERSTAGAEPVQSPETSRSQCERSGSRRASRDRWPRRRRAGRRGRRPSDESTRPERLRIRHFRSYSVDHRGVHPRYHTVAGAKDTHPRISRSWRSIDAMQHPPARRWFPVGRLVRDHEIDLRIQTSETACMTGKGLIRSLRRRAKADGRTFKVNRKRGKGSHAMVSFGERRSFVPLHGGDLPPGTRRAILRQLGVRPEELESEE